jgi:Holliday junction resolvase RusA-like endonuclease
MTEFTCYVKPKGQGSMIPLPNGRMRHGKDVIATRHAIAAAALEAGCRPIDGPVAITVTAYMLRGKTVKREYPTVAPDADKLLRLVGDALTGVAYNDDKQIVEATVRKLYSDVPRVYVRVEAVNHVDRQDAKAVR